MKVGDHCSRVAVSIYAGADIAEASRLMRDQGVGFLVVYREGDQLCRPIGVLTARDVVTAVTACGIDARSIAVEDVMTSQPLVARDTDDLAYVLQAMRQSGVRRLPVVDLRGALAGVIAMDEAVGALAGSISEMAGVISREQGGERRVRAA